MSVLVRINIADGRAYREMMISRVEDGPKLSVNGETGKASQINTYEVAVTNSSTGTPLWRRARFEHDFYDDVTVLIAKAGEAIRKEHRVL